MGHKVDNWKLYPGALLEMARVVKPETGRCCLLTEDKKCIIKVSSLRCITSSQCTLILLHGDNSAIL